MKTFESGGYNLAYERAGAGDPVILVHGFGSNKATNWLNTGWFDVLIEAGFEVAAFDHRGHGESDKPHEVEAYGDLNMANDLLAFMAHLAWDNPFVIGYSMGSSVSLRFMAEHADRLRACVMGGSGELVIESGLRNSDRIAEALEAPSLSDVTDPLVRPYRDFADRQKADLKALAACIRFRRPPLNLEALAQVATPVLVATGSDDDAMGSPQPIADLFPNGEAVLIPGRDHMKAVADRFFKSSAIEFFDRFR